MQRVYLKLNMKSLAQQVKKMFGDKIYPQRSRLQNKALHLYFTLLSEELNAAGYDIKEVLSKIKIDIPWTPSSVKNDLWRPIQKKMLDTDSTTQLDTTDITEIYEALDRAMRERLGIEVEFPSEEKTENYLKSLKCEHK